MPTVGQLITKGLTYYEGLSSYDNANLRNRAQLLIFLQQTLIETENGRDLKYLYKDDSSITIAVNATTFAAPSDYRDMGMEGQIFVPTLSRNIDGPVPDGRILQLRYENGGAQRCIEEFGYWAGLFQIAYSDAAYPLVIHYLQQVQTLSDSSDPTLVTDDSTVLVMPAQYHWTVLLPGMLAKSNMVKDELRNAQADVYKGGQAQMYVRERPRRGGLQIWPETPGVAY